jgi:hypothetical protein
MLAISAIKLMHITQTSSAIGSAATPETSHSSVLIRAVKMVTYERRNCLLMKTLMAEKK